MTENSIQVPIKKRGKGKYKCDYGIADIYRAYRKTIEKGTVYDMSQREFTKIAKLWGEKASDFMMLEAEEVSTFSALGSFRIRKSMRSNIDDNRITRNIDRALSRKYNKIIYYTNEHSDGNTFYFHWCKIKVPIKNIKKYRFKATRTRKERLAKLIKSGEYDYFQ